MAVRTVYLRPWQPPPFSPSRSTAGIPRGSGVEEGGAADRVGNITIVVNPPGSVAPGTSVTLTAVRTGGSAPMTYQWHDPTDTPIPGATGNSYTFTATVSGTYKVVVDSPGAVDAPVAATVAVVVTAAPTIGTVTVTGPTAVQLPPAAAPWTPADLPEVVFWFDAEDSIVLNGSRVSQWTDRGSAKTVVSQANASMQPLYTTVGGKRYVDSETLQQGLLGTLLASPERAVGYYFCVVDITTSGAASTYDTAFSLRETYQTSFGCLFTATPGAPSMTAALVNIGDVSISEAKVNYTLLTAPELVNLADYGIGINFGLGVKCFQSKASSQLQLAGQDIGIGTDGIHVPNRGFVSGRIAQLISIAPGVSQSDMEKLEGWSAHAYGLAGSLPANHPYKTAPPTQ